MRGSHSLVSDDITRIRLLEGRELVGTSSETTRYHMEVRGIGIIDMVHASDVPVALAIGLDGEVERFPLEEHRAGWLGVQLPLINLDPRAPSAAIHVELAVKRELSR